MMMMMGMRGRGGPWRLEMRRRRSRQEIKTIPRSLSRSLTWNFETVNQLKGHTALFLCATVSNTQVLLQQRFNSLHVITETLSSGKKKLHNSRPSTLTPSREPVVRPRRPLVPRICRIASQMSFKLFWSLRAK